MKIIAVFVALLVISAAKPAAWTIQEINAALQDPRTDPAIIPYLETALNKIMTALHEGLIVESIIIPIPGDFEKPEINPSPVDIATIPEIKPISAPLVQVIVNVNQKKTESETPVIVDPIDDTEHLQIDNNPALVPSDPAPTNPIDVIAVNPEPIENLDVSNAGILV